MHGQGADGREGVELELAKPLPPVLAVPVVRLDLFGVNLAGGLGEGEGLSPGLVPLGGRVATLAGDTAPHARDLPGVLEGNQAGGPHADIPPAAVNYAAPEPLLRARLGDHEVEPVPVCKAPKPDLVLHEAVVALLATA
jgi:hypothetical protein